MSGARPSPEYMDRGTRTFLLVVLALLAIYVWSTPDFADSGVTILGPRPPQGAPDLEPEGERRGER